MECIWLVPSNGLLHAVAVQAIALSEIFQSHAMKILIADDDELYREWLRMALTKAGASVTEVVNGLAAVDAAQAANGFFDAILMDMRMPFLDGLEAAKQIRQFDSHARIVIMTAANRSSPDYRIAAEEFDAVLSKPIDLSQLYVNLGLAYRDNMEFVTSHNHVTHHLNQVRINQLTKSYGHESICRLLRLTQQKTREHIRDFHITLVDHDYQQLAFLAQNLLTTLEKYYDDGLVSSILALEGAAIRGDGMASALTIVEKRTRHMMLEIDVLLDLPEWRAVS